jgi:hypothetical protein
MGLGIENPRIVEASGLEFYGFWLVWIKVINSIATVGTKFSVVLIATLGKTLPLRQLTLNNKTIGLNEGGNAKRAGRQFLAGFTVTGHYFQGWG